VPYQPDARPPPAPYRPDANVSPAAAEQESDKGEHWYGQLRPWEHFIPVQADLSDLEKTLERIVAALAREERRAGGAPTGGAGGALSVWRNGTGAAGVLDDGAALAQIARAGQAFVLEQLRPRDVRCYWLQLLSALAAAERRGAAAVRVPDGAYPGECVQGWWNGLRCRVSCALAGGTRGVGERDEPSWVCPLRREPLGGASGGEEAR
jgi:hypothetical protein